MTPERLERIKYVLSRRQMDLTVVLDHVHKHRNHAAILRTCDAVGIQHMHVVIDERDHRPFRGTAMGSQQWVDVHKHATMSNAIDAVKLKGMQVLVANYSDRALPYTDIDFCQPTALVMGAEKKGASDTALAQANHEIYVPMVGMVESYNVSVAAGIILNEALRQRMQKTASYRDQLSPLDVQHYLFKWGYSRLAEFCEQRNIPFPQVDEYGDIVDPDGQWRALTRNKSV